MADLYVYYAIFAIATAFAAVYELLNPVVYKLKKSNRKLDNLVLIYIVYFLLSVVLAPLIFLSCIVPSYSDRFKHALELSLFPED